jgi:predicted DCC family thiol-disulfide oxidoreductase YuxK
MCVYADYAKQSDLPIAIDDLTQSGLEKWGVTEDEATRLLHVEHQGKLYIGYEAMVILWEQMPRYRWLARISRIPVLFQILSWGYTHIVARIIYNRHMRRKAKGLV